MNCREFEDIVNDLARAKMIDAASRVAGLAHAETCERCALRLSDRRALSAGLKSLAASDEGKDAPDSVEIALLAAFRAQAPNHGAKHLPAQSRTWPKSLPGNWHRWTLAAAAAILIAFGLIVYRAIQNEPRKDNQKDNRALTEKTPAPQPSVNREEHVVKENGVPAPRHRERAPRSRRGNELRLDKPLIFDSVTAVEYTTEFFPLSYGGDRKPMESGEVIRVQMPRSALITLGLPVDVERADTLVKADLLVGEDGLARAIRFVQ